jgi:hypothetical protein
MRRHWHHDKFPGGRYASSRVEALPKARSRLSSPPILTGALCAARGRFLGDCGMGKASKAAIWLALGGMMLAGSAHAEDQFKLGNNQRIACSRGLMPGKLNTATCRSYAYVFNTRTSEYFRCTVNLALTRNNKEILSVQTDGNCVKKPRIFDQDSHYSFEATETEPPNTNSFFGQGGYAIWASDTTAQKVRGCITIASGLGKDVSKCVDMTFQ